MTSIAVDGSPSNGADDETVLFPMPERFSLDDPSKERDSSLLMDASSRRVTSPSYQRPQNTLGLSISINNSAITAGTGDGEAADRRLRDTLTSPVAGNRRKSEYSRTDPFAPSRPAERKDPEDENIRKRSIRPPAHVSIYTMVSPYSASLIC